MMIRCFIISFLSALTGLLSSCGTPAHMTVHNIDQIEKAVAAEKIVIVFDTTRRSGQSFQEYFIDTFTRLTQNTPKRLSIMTGYEYTRSPYNEPNKAFDDILFITIEIDRCEKKEYNTAMATFLMTVQYKGQSPLLMGEVTLGLANPVVESSSWRGHELAKTIYEELNKQNIL